MRRRYDGRQKTFLVGESWRYNNLPQKKTNPLEKNRRLLSIAPSIKKEAVSYCETASF